MFVAGSITLTNLSTDQLVGMNGNQMALLVWWVLAAIIGLIILAKVFIPVYYKYTLQVFILFLLLQSLNNLAFLLIRLNVCQY